MSQTGPLYRDQIGARCVRRDPGECRISSTTGTPNPEPWTPVFDGNGLIVNPHPNVTITTYTCTTCNRSWTTTDADAPGQAPA